MFLKFNIHFLIQYIRGKLQNTPEFFISQNAQVMKIQFGKITETPGHSEKFEGISEFSLTKLDAHDRCDNN